MPVDHQGQIPATALTSPYEYVSTAIIADCSTEIGDERVSQVSP